MPELKEQPTLSDIQAYVRELEVERGFENDPILNKCLLLGEEVGELFKAIRKQERIVRVDRGSESFQVEEELADVLLLVSTIANRFDIDLESAFRKKEEKNKKRTWV